MGCRGAMDHIIKWEVTLVCYAQRSIRREMGQSRLYEARHSRCLAVVTCI